MVSVKRCIFLIFFIIICIMICDSTRALELKVVDKKSSGQAVRGEIIIEVKKDIIDLGEERGVVPREKVNINSKSLTALNKKYGLISIERLFSGTRKDEPSDIYVFRFSPKADIKKLVSAYKEDRDVIYAEPNYTVHIE